MNQPTPVALQRLSTDYDIQYVQPYTDGSYLQSKHHKSQLSISSSRLTGGHERKGSVNNMFDQKSIRQSRLESNPDKISLSSEAKELIMCSFKPKIINRSRQMMSKSQSVDLFVCREQKRHRIHQERLKMMIEIDTQSRDKLIEDAKSEIQQQIERNCQNVEKQKRPPDFNYLVRTPMKYSEHNSRFKPRTPRVSSLNSVSMFDNTSYFQNSQMSASTAHRPTLNRKSISLVNKMKEQGKFGKSMVDHVSNVDLERRKKRSKENYIIQVNSHQEQRNQVKTNEKSNVLVGKKFQADYKECLKKVFEGQVEEYIDQNQFLAILKRLNFISEIQKEQPDKVNSLKFKEKLCQEYQAWDLLVQAQIQECHDGNRKTIKANSLYNFLCYLQNLEQFIITSLYSQTSEAPMVEMLPNTLGYCMNGIFYIHSKNEKARLIKQFYYLQHCKIQTKQRRFGQEQQNRIINTVRNVKETFKPKINANISSRSRSGLKNHKQYSAVLHQRDKAKLLRKEQIRDENKMKEMNECSFTPATNVKNKKKASKLRSMDLGIGNQLVPGNHQFSGDQGQDKRKFLNNLKNTQHQYVSKYLAKPRLRPEIDKNQRDYEKQKALCTFKPKTLKRSKSREQKKEAQLVIFRMELKVNGKVDTIEIHKNDNIQSIISAFSKKHNLKESKKEKLNDLVMQTVSSYNDYSRQENK